MHFEFTDHRQFAIPAICTADTRKLTWLRLGDRVPRQMVLAHRHGVICGVLSFAIRRGQLELYLAWVHPRYRRTGLAKVLLYLVIDATEPSRVWAECITNRGLAFMCWGQQAFPRIDFMIERFRR